MPNWCSNYVSFSHSDKEQLSRLEEAAKKSKLFETMAPLSSGEWDYNTAIREWGTKWEADVSDVFRESDGSVYVCFLTAWAPPIEFYELMEDLGFVVDALYLEPGICFAGHYTEGEDSSVTYDFSNEDWASEVGDQEIVDLLEDEYENYQSWQEEAE